MRLRLGFVLSAVLLSAPAHALAADTPIDQLHCNDANGLPLLSGQTETITGVVTAQFPGSSTARFYLQDPTGGILVLGPPTYCGAGGDSLRVTGTVSQINGETCLRGSPTPLTISVLATGRPIPDTLTRTPAQVAATFGSNDCEPEEGHLVVVGPVLIRTATFGMPGAATFALNTNYALIHAAADSATNYTMMRVTSVTGCSATNPLIGTPITVDRVVQVVGVISQIGSGLPYNSGYLVLPRGPSDLTLAPATDGTLDPGAAFLSVQTTQTNFGDASSGTPGFTDGSELDGASMSYDAAGLHLFLGGNLESNFNHLEIFVDSHDGGQNRLLGNNAFIDDDGLNRMGDDGSGNGLRFDAPFSADYWVGMQGGDDGTGNYLLSANYATLPTAGGGLGYFLGQTRAAGVGALSNGNNPFGIQIAIDNRNTGGVSSGCGTASGAGVTRGVELLIPADAIGHPSRSIKICVFVNGRFHDFVSNQVLGPLPAGSCNLGEPRNVDFSALPGDQFIALTGLPVVHCSEPPSLLFQANGEVATGAGPGRVAIADLDGDGRPDLVTANVQDGTVSLLLGVGDGTFDPKIDYPCGANPAALAIADFNGDAHPDIAVANDTDPGSVSILLANGDGTFAAPLSAAVAPNPTGIAVGRINADAAPDLVTSRYYDCGVNCEAGTLSLLIGQGDGTFAPHQDMATQADGNSESHPQDVAVADLNGDGKADLVVRLNDLVWGFAWASVYLGHGDGTFASPTIWYTGANTVTGLAIADVDHDGALDLIFADDAQDLHVQRGKGDGTFSGFPELVSTGYSVGSPLVIADLDGDGNLDAACPSITGASVSVMLGCGDGTFGPAATLTAAAGTSAIAVGDGNGDGRPDLIASHASSNTVSVWSNQGELLSVPPRSHSAASLMVRAYPNPTPHALRLEFTLPRAAEVSARIVDLAGRTVATLARVRWSAGVHVVNWDRRMSAGGEAPPGVYWYDVRAAGDRVVRHVVLLK